MFKRFARPYMLALFGGLLLASACAAQSGTPVPYTEGNEYVTLPGPHQRYSDTGKVEVVEVFSYGCIHCAHFAPIAEKLRKELPAGVEFKLVPAPFSEQWLPFARAYYAANQLGVVDRTHRQLFTAKFDEHYPINSMDELADFYAGQGVNRAKFLRIATSPEATAKLNNDLTLIQKWQVDGTPSIVIDGKYKVTNVQSQEQLAAVALWLAKRELSGK
ncbi:thiol:disulfide interchange protein DsbA/DsbL [Rhodanobacter sp. C05]|uniref:thiol:disulfide interchange protein DsbA/DsbL n=1 Tax=Rhodanobacter sp. C05 TaxID=1945855 RepID=UPI0009871DA0|nr:thiol:disulfide interchange protein DsbA/DsbL [Rhodanobacter sp. C05]OOG40259.1 disulfide bond formation protein DsbA [Rhodanobacter sp. C05]